MRSGLIARLGIAALLVSASGCPPRPAIDSGGGGDASGPGMDSDLPGTDAGGGGLCDGVTPVAGMPALGLDMVASVNLPVDIEAPPGDVGRLFIVEQPGRIRIVTLPGDTLLPAPFLDIVSMVQNSGFPGDEQGLLGLAFHPDYAANGRFFVFYTESGGSNEVLAEFTASAGDPNLADPFGTTMLTIATEQSNHNGGALEFGPDGFLYIGVGDGGLQGDPDGDSRDLNVHRGKILRLDVDAPAPYVPPSNPFAAGGGAGEVYAYGFRNPWRLSFDRLTGDLYVGDVGQDNWEEVTVAPAPDRGIGGDFGWNNCEGLTPYAGSCTGSIAPAVVYPHAEGCSVTAGYVYRGCLMPGWHGTFFYGDYCDGFVRSFVWDGTAATGEMTVAGVSGNVGSVSTFGLDARGELYVADLFGSVYRIVPQ